jgi:hypothetical protein
MILKLLTCLRYGYSTVGSSFQKKYASCFSEGYFKTMNCLMWASLMQIRIQLDRYVGRRKHC